MGSSFVETMPLEAQENEEKFDLALLNSLEIDIVPRFGDPRIPDDLLVQLGRTLQIASRIHDLDLQRDAALARPDTPVSPPPNGTLPNGKSKKSHSRSASKSFSPVTTAIPEGSTSTGKLLPRERFSYWCLDLLFLVCSDRVKGLRWGPNRSGFWADKLLSKNMNRHVAELRRLFFRPCCLDVILC